ncbi:MAG: 1,4-alpha-glucan branching protein GlgB [Sandaracinaceae bacterium]|nr:1,4-alpha-glucan branching protein GlgB [Sandaracinaceae bacterium]
MRRRMREASPGVVCYAGPAMAGFSLSEQDLYLFNEGTHQRLWDCLGARPTASGATFRVWAPDAERVSVIGDFNGWDPGRHPLTPRAASGIWEADVPDVPRGALYKYWIRGRNGHEEAKADPYGLMHETPPKTASVVWDLDYAWQDDAWMAERATRNATRSPMSIYEVHLGSWRRVPEDADRPLTYRELAHQLGDYVSEQGFTHVELLPVMEHPFGGSWGYQVTGYFAPTSRFGTVQDFMYLVDHLHQRGIGVILDWVPAHFPTDAHGLALFDGTHLYEHADPRLGFHPDWRSAIFNYGRHEVRAFLVSSARFWLEVFHADGLRVDGVASMLYLDYSREEGEWIPNVDGGRENYAAIDFLRQLNEAVYLACPDTQTIAEESTSWPMVSRPTFMGGLGFGLKWDMGWMHDTLRYLQRDPIHRCYHHNEITFRSLYAFHETFVLPLSHDEVVHGKGSLLNKMPGDRWQKFANLRLLFAYMYSQPGKKLLFMGSEIAQWREWGHDFSLDWHLLDEAPHEGVQRLVRDLNHAYSGTPALHARDAEASGFEWIDGSDSGRSVLCYLRHGEPGDPPVLVALNFTPVVRHDYRIGVPRAGDWEESLNTDAEVYGGSGVGNLGRVVAEEVPAHGRPWSLRVTLPPLAAVWFRAPEGA